MDVLVKTRMEVADAPVHARVASHTTARPLTQGSGAIMTTHMSSTPAKLAGLVILLGLASASVAQTGTNSAMGSNNATAKATSEIEKLSKRKLALNSTMFNELDEKTLADLNAALATIAKNARLAARLLAIDAS
jgi:hypothetical protein